MRTFGCVAYAKHVGPGVNKLTDRAMVGVFLGYEPGTKGYRVYDPVKNKLMVTRDVVFDEARQWNWEGNSATTESAESVMPGIPDVFQVQWEDTVSHPTMADPEDNSTDAEAAADEAAEDESPMSIPSFGGGSNSPPQTPVPIPGVPMIQWATPPTGQSADSEGVPLRYRTIPNLLETTDELQDFEYSGFCFMAAEEPRSVEEALSEQCWRQAMQTEMQAIEDNQTWDVSVLPPKSKAIGLKWVFKIKRDPEGKIIKHKARLVAKGYAQRYGVDFDEVFAPVARIETVRVLLALAAQGGWEVHHMDVKSAFLNGDLSEIVYVQQPPGFVIGSRDKVLKLKKALYGLKQAPRAWNAKLDRELTALGFVRSQLDHAVYRRRNRDSFLLVGVYVDDLIISGPDVQDIRKFKDEMKKKFSMSDLGLLSYYLGIEVKQSANGITLCQSSYAIKILEVAGMSDCNSCETPMECRLKLRKLEDGEPVRPTEYRSIIGSLRYIINTRPDLAYAVGVVSRYMEAPGKEHWAAVKHILRYLKGTVRYGCRYDKGAELKPILIGYSDSDFAGDVEDRKSTTGIGYFLGRSLVTWVSQKQRIVALSSCEAEYVAGAAAACQGIWLSRLIADMLGTKEMTVKLLMDNQSAIALSKNPVHHDRSKHIDTRYHFLRQCIEEGKVEVDHVGTDQQLADLFTKALGRVKFVELRSALGVVEVHQV
jgi:hypothetical protein